MRTSIYVLLDQYGDIRYVGKTRISLNSRLWRHVYDARNTNNRTHKAVWIRSMLAANYQPIIELIAAVSGNGSAAERRYITKYRQDGYDLTNCTDGGDGGATYGMLGKRHTKETKRRLAIAGHVRIWTDASRAKLSASLTGKRLGCKLSKAHVAALKIAQRKRAKNDKSSYYRMWETRRNGK